jgi:hypothetical protein
MISKLIDKLNELSIENKVKETEEIKLKEKKIINKGTGAGGANTTLSGGSFEKITSIENKLLENNFNKIIVNNKKKYSYYLELNTENKKIIYVTQNGLKVYMKNKFNIDIEKKTR